MYTMLLTSPPNEGKADANTPSNFTPAAADCHQFAEAGTLLFFLVLSFFHRLDSRKHRGSLIVRAEDGGKVHRFLLTVEPRRQQPT